MEKVTIVRNIKDRHNGLARYGNFVVGGRKYSIGFVWLIGLILSFAHERPIVILSSMDRINPRLFDIMVLLGVLLVLPRQRGGNQLPKLFYIWTFIVFVFFFCATLYAGFILPDAYGNYSLFFAAKYLEGWLAIFIALKIPLTPERKVAIHRAVILGGLYVACYSIYQYGMDITRIEIATGKFITYFTGPLGYSYFHIAQFSSLCAVMALVRFSSARTSARRWFIFALTAFIAWPILYAGSRSGLALSVISISVAILFLSSVQRIRMITAVVSIAALFTVLHSPNAEKLLEQPSTISRLIIQEVGQNSISNRLEVMTSFSLDKYKWGTLMPLIGGGFYVAPVLEGNHDRYRVGYGIHNSYLFAFEQGGLLALAAFLYFLYFSGSKLYGLSRYGLGPDKYFAQALFCYFIASLAVFFVGQIFWLGFETGNFNTFIVLLMILAVKPSVDKGALIANESLRNKSSTMG